MMAARAKILDLVERFQRNLKEYKQGNYNETQLRREFIDPFFEELGWDVVNKQGYAEAYKEVVHEDAIKVGKATKAPDYCFRIGGVRKFFLEAKKPSINIIEDAQPSYQLRRYAWSAKLPLSILTNFEEFAVYKYWLGLLNSKLLWWFLTNTGYVLRGGYYVFKTNYLNPFPIHDIDFSDSTDKARHDQIVKLVHLMLDLNKQLTTTKTPQSATVIQRQIESADRQIDQLVYELYGLTEEEIKIVESSAV
jgi:hypothetical protein